MTGDITSNINHVAVLFKNAFVEIRQILRNDKNEFLSFLSVNLLTTSRLLWGELVRAHGFEESWIICFVLFNLGLLTDYLDGLIAVLFGGHSMFGKYNDKISDFCFMSFSLLSFRFDMIYYLLIILPWLIIWGSRFIFAKGGKWQRKSQGLSPIYFMVVILIMEIVFAKLAFNAFFPIMLAVIIIITIIALATKRHRLTAWHQDLTA